MYMLLHHLAPAARHAAPSAASPDQTERLKALEDCAEQLSPELQEKLAAQIESLIDNAIWDAQLRDPANLEVLRELAEEAQRGPKVPMPTPYDTGDAHLLDPDDLEILMQPEDIE